MAFDTVIDKTKLEGAMTATADAIRSKNGTTDTITWDTTSGFADAISTLSAEELIQHASIPDYVKGEALRVAQLVQAARQDDSIVFIAMSDNHHYGEQANSDEYPDANGIQTTESNIHAAMAAKILAYGLQMDFIAHLGDITWGNQSTTTELLHSQVEDLQAYLKEVHTGVPCFFAIGNHDTGIYRYNYQVNTNDTEATVETGEYLYNTYTALSASDDTVFGDTTNGGYCYRDFAAKKLRVFLLNTSEALTATQSDKAMLGSQQQWLANALLDLNTKTDASEWSFIILSHYPADYGNTMPLSELLRAYVEGSSVSITLETGSTVTANFSGSNSAKMIAQFHGHIHNFLTSKLYSYASGSGVQYDAWRIGIPNGQVNRENYYSTVGSYSDINFAESASYGKTSDSATDTSFVVNVINPSEQVIHSICYGAGRDRVIGYGATTYYSIISALSNVSISNATSYVEDGGSFTATITPHEHRSLTSVIVTMDGVDVTSSVYGNGVITIQNITGNVVITAIAKLALACVNQIPISTDSSGSIYNGVGYKTNVYISSDGNDKDLTGYCSTGYIPVQIGDVIRLENMTFSQADDKCRIFFYDANKQFVYQVNASSPYYMDTTFKGVLENGNYVQLTLNNHANISTAAYIRICCPDIDEDSVLTVNEEILYIDELEDSYAITKTLSNVTNSNSASSVTGGASYTATITAVDGYELKSVVVTMDGLDITDTVYANGTINIPIVTGNISITATAEKIPTYTNQIPISTDTSGAIYNGTGYKSGVYINSSGVDATRSGVYSTGFIPCKAGTSYVIRMKNVGFDSDATDKNYYRFTVYDSSKSKLAQFNAGATSAAYGTVTDADGNWTEFSVRLTTSSVDVSTSMAYFRLSAGYIGSDSVITINEAIE